MSSRASWWAFPWGPGNAMSVARLGGVDGEEAVGALLELEPRFVDASPQPVAPRRVLDIRPFGLGELVEVGGRVVERPPPELVAHVAEAPLVVGVGARVGLRVGGAVSRFVAERGDRLADAGVVGERTG